MSGVGKYKCEVNGDNLCDTKPSVKLENTISQVASKPFLYTGVPWEGDVNDQYGESWVPETRNMMSYLIQSYAGKTLSTMQIAVMNSYLPSYTSSDDSDFTISGPQYLCPGQPYTFTIDNLSGYGNTSNIRWYLSELEDDFDGTQWQMTGTPLSLPESKVGSGLSVIITPSSADYHKRLIAVPEYGTAPAVIDLIVIDPTSEISIQGPSNVNSNVTFTFQTKQYSGSFAWSVPFGWTILSGQGTYKISTRPRSSASPGDVTVFNSDCSGLNGSKLVSIGGFGFDLKEDDEGAFKIYPNPSSGSIKVESSYGIGQYNMEVYDLIGNLVISKKALTSHSNWVSLHTAGTYILKFKYSNGVISKIAIVR